MNLEEKRIENLKRGAFEGNENFVNLNDKITQLMANYQSKTHEWEGGDESYKEKAKQEFIDGLNSLNNEVDSMDFSPDEKIELKKRIKFQIDGF